MERVGKGHPGTGDETGRPLLTAVVCTRGRPRMLRRAVQSLLVQSEPPDEILVVDNAPEDGRSRAVALEADGGPPVRYLVEPVPGLDFARNLALREAAGAIVAFLDDDAVADIHWARETREAFRTHAELDACMGLVGPLVPDSPGALLFEANGGFGRGERAIHLPRDRGSRLVPLIARSLAVGSGCSMALLRDRARGLGGFDEALDMGEALPGGGDLDMLWRILEAGGQVRYEPRVRALHEHRPDEAAAARQIVEHNRGLVAMLVKALRAADVRGRVPILIFLGWRLAKPGLRLMRKLFGRDPLPAWALLALWRGCWRGLRAYPAALREVERRRGLVQSARKRRAPKQVNLSA
jgi:glycosyltransferase involved in cell wall biosynthesis